METGTVQASVQVSPELLDKVTCYHIDLSEATEYGIEQLAQNQINVAGQNFSLSSMWWGFLGCSPAALSMIIFQPVGYWLLADLLLLTVGMLGGTVLSMRRKWHVIMKSIRNSHRKHSPLPAFCHDGPMHPCLRLVAGIQYCLRHSQGAVLPGIAYA